MTNDDAISLMVIQAALEAACDEMFAVLKKTAMSPIIYEVLDVGTAVTDGKGNLLSSGAGIPTFVGVLDKAVKRILELHSDIQDGDMFITNDPYFGGVTHLSDVVIALPVFAQGELVAWSATIAHWNDIGGMTAGSMSVKATEIFQEGLRLPAVKLFDAGNILDSVLDIIMMNSRLPDFVQGDLWAQVAACRKASLRIKDLIKTYSLKRFNDAIEKAFEEGEKRSQLGLSKLQKGSYSIEERQDDGAIWKATISISEDAFTVDLRDNPKQVAAPHNTSRDGAFISCQMIFKALTDSSRFANAGSFKMLEVLTKEGSIFHAVDSAPQAYYFETRIRLYDMLWHCLAKAMPELLPAGHFGTIFGTVIAGRHPETNQAYTMVEPQMGGWGATKTRDGLSAMYSASHGDTFNCPAEICEARYGIEVMHKKLNEGIDSSSLHKGGHGLDIKYRLGTNALLSFGYSHYNTRVWSLNQGQEGSKNQLSIISDNQQSFYEGFASGVKLKKDDEIEIKTANGGGWGNT